MKSVYFLSGNYGTGKTDVALKKLELLYESLKQDEVIYYVNFAGKSQLYLEILEKNKTKEKVKVLRGGTNLSNIIKCKILPNEVKCNTKNIQYIVDEYDSQDLSEKESASLYQIFQEEEQFHHSTILIAVQPTEIIRTEHFTTGGKKKEYSQAKHMFEKLKEIMEVFQLRYVMRTTVEINNLIKLTQSYLDNKTNQYKGERQNCIEKREKSTSEKLFPELLQESSKTVNNTESKPNLSSQNPCAKSSYSLNVASGFQLASPVHTTPVYSEERIDQDELYKLMSRSPKKIKKPSNTSHQILSYM